MAMNRQQKRMLQKQGQLGADGAPGGQGNNRDVTNFGGDTG